MKKGISERVNVFFFPRRMPHPHDFFLKFRADDYWKFTCDVCFQFKFLSFQNICSGMTDGLNIVLDYAGWAQGASGGDGGQPASTRSQLGGFRDGGFTGCRCRRKSVISLPNYWRRRIVCNASAFIRRRRHFSPRPPASPPFIAGTAIHGRPK